jgi:putative phage-type endonuclease
MNAPTIHRDIEQHTPEWYAIKAGKWSASKAAVIMGGLDTGGLASLVKDIAWERVFGPTEGGFQSEAMKRGNLLESLAREWFEEDQGLTVEQVGFVSHGTLPNVGWSPDGMCGLRHGLEAKCPLHKAWMDCKKQMKVPSEYRWQCRWAMWVGDLEAMSFVAWHPKSGGILIPCEVTAEECEQMAERVALLEPKVAHWIEVIGNSRNTKPVPASALNALNDPEASF